MAVAWHGDQQAFPSVPDRVAAFVRHQIRSGVYRPGDKLPSVRDLSRMLGVSISSTVGGYRLLELEGAAWSRPQSGFYVQLRSGTVSVPTTKPPRRPATQNIDELFLRVLTEKADKRFVQLATADPANGVLPTTALARISRRFIQEEPELVLRYPDFIGVRELREQVARRMLATGCALMPDDLLITNGCSEALSLSLRVVCKPGDVVAIESPAYYGLLHLLRSEGLQVLEVSTDPQTGMCLDALEEILQDTKVSAVLATPNYNNPLGSLMPQANKKRLVEMLAKREIPLIEDDVYGELGFEEERPVTCKAFDKQGLVLHCSSISKTLAPGYRIGWVAGGRFHQALQLEKFSTSVSAAALQQYVIAEYLQVHRYSHTLRRARETYESNIHNMTMVAKSLMPAGTRFSSPQGGFVLWVELPQNYDAVQLYDRAADERITFMPGPAFSAQGLYRNCFRLNAGTWSSAVERGVARIGELALMVC